MPQKDFCISGARHGLRTGIRVLAGLLAAVAISGCATLERLPAVTYAEARQIDILDTPDARFYVSDTNRIYDVAIKAYQRSNRARPAQTRHYLALSGGGDDGAFGAGLLVGWSAHGDRPEFDMVTGVSTGALSAPFAFLGRAYDQKPCRDVYRNERGRHLPEACDVDSLPLPPIPSSTTRRCAD